jgi:hypothetical protein
MRTRTSRLVAALAVAGIAAVLSASPAAAHGDGVEDEVDLTSLPVGQTVTEPTVGGLWSCQSEFSADAAGAQVEGPWFNGDGTWDATEKYTVDGSVEWPNAELSVVRDGNSRKIVSNNLPTIHTTGEFPIAADDDAYEVDRNPSAIAEADVVLELDATPERVDEPSCVGGEVGILKSGVVLLNAIDAGGRDAVAYEVQDSCDGHPNIFGYHYHSASDCVLEELDPGTGQSRLIGWAFDGFGIYGPRDADGNILTSADLDECHGITSKVKFNGKVQRIYHYVATYDYPYTVGCFRGTSAVQGPIGGAAGGGAPTGAPPARP